MKACAASSLCETATCVSGFEVCKTSKLHSTRSVLPRQGHALRETESSRKGTSLFFLLLQKEPKSSCSDVQKVASGKFLCVGDRRNRENCERMWARRPCFKESTPSCDLGSNRRSIRCFYWNDRHSLGNRLCANRFFSQYRRQWFEPLQTPSVAQTDMRLCTNSKRILLITVGYDGLRKGDYGVVGMGCFFR